MKHRIPSTNNQIITNVRITKILKNILFRKLAIGAYL